MLIMGFLSLNKISLYLSVVPGSKKCQQGISREKA